MLLGGDRETERIDHALESARAGMASVFVINGETGIAALLDYAVERARGMTVVRIRALQSEAAMWASHRETVRRSPQTKKTPARAVGA